MILSRARRFGVFLAGARVRRMLLFAGLAFAVLPVGSALAATTVGQTGTPLSDLLFSGGFENVQTDAAMPGAGLVTSFQTQSASSCFNGFNGPYNLQVLRPEGGNQYLVLGDAGDQTDLCDGNLHSYAPVGGPVAVQAGDMIGVYAVGNWQGFLSDTNGTINFDEISEPVVGDTVSLPSSESGTGDESATFVSASSLAQKMVNDTDHLKPGTALTDKATAIQAAVNTGDTATACADITAFLGLVKAQTNKHLSQANANLLTTDANNLAAALGC